MTSWVQVLRKSSPIYVLSILYVPASDPTTKDEMVRKMAEVRMAANK